MLSVYEAEKTVLNGGKYDLSVEENKINVFLASNAITASEHEELLALAHDNTTMDTLLPSESARLTALEERIGALEKRENGVTEWPEWVKPLSADKYVKYGEGVTFVGNHYLFVNKDKPARAGFDPSTYPKSWYKVADLSTYIADALAEYEASLPKEEKPQTDVTFSAPTEEDQNTSTDETTTENEESKK